MDNRTVKIALACFIGGALMGVMALWCTPQYWYIGILAGMAGGYLSYEFRVVLRAVPVDWKMVKKGSLLAANNYRETVRKWDDTFRKWISEKRPIQQICAALILLGLIGTLFVSSQIVPSFSDVTTYLVFFNIWIVFVVFAVSLMESIVERGADYDRVYWKKGRLFLSSLSLRQQYLRGLGYREEALTYRTFCRWSLLGIWSIMRIFTWDVWKGLFCFAYYLFKLVHSEERILCAIDSVLGGAVAYLCLIRPEMYLSEKIVLVLFCGLLGAAFGVLNWEIVSKRMLKIAPLRN